MRSALVDTTRAWTSVHAVAEQPAGEEQSTRTDQRDRPELIEQELEPGSFEEQLAQDDQFLTALNQDVGIMIRPRAKKGGAGHISVLAAP